MRAAVAERGTRAGAFLARVFAVFALAIGGQFWIAAPSHAAGGACAPGTGVTVVVQWQSSIQTRCAPGAQESALSALSAAGFSPTMASREPGFLCRIDGNPASDPCFRASPADAYWAFWHAPAGGAWVYSQLGAASYAPPTGSVIGFRFGSGAAPAIGAPVGSAPTSPKPSPKPSPSPRTAPSSSAAPKPTSTPTHSSARPSSSKPSTAGTPAASGSTAGRSSSAAATNSSGGSSSVSSASASSSPSSTSAVAGAGPTSSGGTTASRGGSVAGAAVEAGAAPSSVDTGSGNGSGGSVAGPVGAAVLLILAGAAVFVRKRLQ